MGTFPRKQACIIILCHVSHSTEPHKSKSFYHKHHKNTKLCHAMLSGDPQENPFYKTYHQKHDRNDKLCHVLLLSEPQDHQLRITFQHTHHKND